MKKIVGIASTPNRESGLLETLNSLSPQVDHIYVWLNGYSKIPEVSLNNITFHLGEDHGATGKIKVLDLFDDSEFYFFMVDDDILYPPDYIEYNIKQYEWGSIQSSHGKIFKTLPTESFNHGDISGYYFGGYISSKEKIHAVGTGVCMTDSSVVRDIPYDSFLEYPNMLDIWVSAYCMANEISMYIVPHQSNWLRPNPKIDQSNSIWERTKRVEDQFRTSVYNHYINS